MEDYDWLEKTYKESIGFCQPIAPDTLQKIAELSALLTGACVQTYSAQMHDPFLTNFKEDVKLIEIFQKAAQYTGISVRIGAASKNISGYLGLYSNDKGVKDLGEFWRAVDLMRKDL